MSGKAAIPAKNLPWGCTQEEWDATSNLREQYAQLMVLADQHSQQKHPWNSWCNCVEMTRICDMSAHIMADIKRCLIRPDFTGDLRKRQEAARTLSEIDAAIITPELVYKIMSLSPPHKDNTTNTGSK